MSRALRSIAVAASTWCASLTCVLAATPTTHAAAPNDSGARAEQLSSQASDAFSEGRFHDAIKLYLDAFDVSKSPETLYNVGFIYEKKLSEPELAIDYYQRVVSTDGVDAALSGKATKRMTALKDARKKKDPVVKPPDVVPDAPSTGPGAGPYILFGTGGAALATGFTFAILATVTHGDFDKAEGADDKRALQKKGKTQALVADLTMGVGGAAILGGIIWLLVGGDDAPPSGGAPGVTPAPAGTGLRFDAQFLDTGGALFTVGGHL